MHRRKTLDVTEYLSENLCAFAIEAVRLVQNLPMEANMEGATDMGNTSRRSEYRRVSRAPGRWVMAAQAVKVIGLARAGTSSAAVGDIAEFPLPSAGSGRKRIAAGPDGTFWFTEIRGAIGLVSLAGARS